MLVRMFLVDGHLDGIRTLELSNSTILLTLVPRHQVAKYLGRPHAGRPGIYFLAGADLTEQSKVYVGEGDPVGQRIQSHSVNKEFWTRAYVFTSKDDYLTKTQIKFLEHTSWQAVKEAARATLDNATIPTKPAISEADQVEMLHFLATLRTLLGAAGATFMEKQAVELAAMPAAGDLYEYKTKGAYARMVINDHGYVVLKDSTAVAEATASTPNGALQRRSELLGAGIIVPDGDGLLRFTTDTPFQSASTAADIVGGGSHNGLLVWKRNGVSLKDHLENPEIE